MAVIKDVMTQYGIVSPYHRIHEIKIGQNTVEFLVYSYASQEAREANATHINQQIITVPLAHFDFDPRDIFYPVVQNHPWSYLKDGTSHIASGIVPHEPVFTVQLPPPPPALIPLPPIPPIEQPSV